MASLKAAAEKYFEVWNAHDSQGLGPLFHDNVTLTDWDVHKEGKAEVIAANQGIFDAVPKINIKVKHFHIAEATSSVCCEIDVILNDDKNTVLKVVDVITFDSAVKITAVRAYKC